jgi:16S rRNA processing protein RimM
MDPGPDRLVVGRVSGVYGVKGFVRVFSETDPRGAIAEFPRLWMQRSGAWECLEVEAGRAHGRGVVVKFRGTDDREAAHGLIGCTLAVERDWLPPLEEGAFYWADLQGLRVETEDGVALGRVEGFMQTGANDVMVVKGDRERLVPWVRGVYVLDVDLDAGLVRVDWDPDF